MKDLLKKLLSSLLALLNTEPGQVAEIGQLKADLKAAQDAANQAKTAAEAAVAAAVASGADAAAARVALEEAKAANVLNDPEIAALIDQASDALAAATPATPVTEPVVETPVIETPVVEEPATPAEQA